jgi:hypothetical protein
MTAVLHLPYSLRGSPSGTYELQTFISKGNFGSVYKATMDDGSTWAVKILAPGDTNGPEEVIMDNRAFVMLCRTRQLKRLCYG